jgi:hypothetical protein
MSDTPETDTLDCELNHPRVHSDRYSEMRNHARKLERERDDYKWHTATGAFEQARQMERARRKEETNDDHE